MFVTHLREHTEVYNKSNTWEDEDEKGADPSNDTDDFTDVRYKHSDDKCHSYPHNCQQVPAAFFKLRQDHTITLPPPTQQRVLDHWSADERVF